MSEHARNAHYLRFLERQMVWEQRALWLGHGIDPDERERRLRKQREEEEQRRRERADAISWTFWKRVDRREPGDCWEWQGPRNGDGYGVLKWQWFEVGPRKTVLAHRVALALHLGRPLTQMALHSCDNAPCCNPSHLREGTAKENTEDAWSRGRFFRVPCQELADWLRHLHSVDGMTITELVQQEWFSRREIVRVLLGETWRSSKQPLCCDQCKPLERTL